MKKAFLHFTLFIFGLILISSCEKEPIDDPQDDPEVVPEIFDLIGQIELENGPHDIAIQGDYAFASRDDKIYIVNLTDPSSPMLIGEFNDLSESNIFESLVIGNNNVLYASCTGIGGIYMIDISDPTNPQLLSKFNPNIYGTTKISPIKLFYANDILWAGGSNGSSGMLVKYNVINPSTLTVNDYWLSSMSGDGVAGVWANSTHVYASTADGNVYSFGVNGISSGPLDNYTFTNEAGHEHWGKSLVGNGTNLYWADWGAGFVNINISNPANMTANSLLTHSSFLNQHPEAEGTNVYDIAFNASTGKIYLANGWSGLVRIGVGNTGIVEDYVDYQYHQNYCIELYKDYAVMGNISGGISGTEKGLKLIKIQ